MLRCRRQQFLLGSHRIRIFFRVSIQPDAERIRRASEFAPSLHHGFALGKARTADLGERIERLI